MTEHEIEVSMADLELALKVLIKGIRERHCDVIEIEHDYFWSIPSNVRYDMDQKPAEFTIGQISASVENVRAVLNRAEQPVQCALVRLADVLRAVGEKPEEASGR